MRNGIQRLSFLSGIEQLGNAREGWTLDHESGFTADRVFRTTVLFERPFNNIPVVHTGIVGFDISNHDAARLKTSVENISPQGFEIVLCTWFNTRLWRVDISWFAIGS